ncbi:MAG: RNA polymerase sigma factor [Chitinophagaceae bacterium]
MNTSRHQHIPDAELLELYYHQKDQQWLGILLERYTLLLLGVCMKYLKNEEAAKDGVQQIFLQVLTAAPKYRIDYFKSWLYMVAKNYCLMQLRGKGRNTKEIKDEIIVRSEDENKPAFTEDEKTYDLLEESLEELNNEQRQCVILFYLQKKSYNEISEKTGYNLMQVKSYIQNGKRNLKLMLERKLNQSASE